MSELRALDRSTVGDVVCCPGGLEHAGRSFCGDQNVVLAWHLARLDEGMRGVVAYEGGAPRGFAEFMPADVAPFPVEAPGAAVLLCFHWAGTEPEDPAHLVEETRLLEAVIAETRASYSGLAAVGWNHPTHYPIELLRRLGWEEVARQEPIALLWLPFRPGARRPRLAPVSFVPRDLRSERRLAVDCAWSARCPYSVSHAARLRQTIATHPDRDRISLAEHVIDTRDDAFRLSAVPWNWDWTYFNGERIDPFAVRGPRLAAEITRHVRRAAADA